LFLSLESMIHDNQLGILDCCSLQDCVPGGSSTQVPEQASVCSPGVLAVVCRLVVLFILLGILNSTISWPLQPRLLMIFTSLTSSSLFVRTGVSLFTGPLSPVSGSCHQCSPEITWLASALLWCSSSRYWGCSSLL